MARDGTSTVVQSGVRITGDLAGSTLYMHPSMEVIGLHEGHLGIVAIMAMTQERWQELADFATEQAVKYDDKRKSWL